MIESLVGIIIYNVFMIISSRRNDIALINLLILWLTISCIIIFFFHNLFIGLLILLVYIGAIAILLVFTIKLLKSDISNTSRNFDYKYIFLPLLFVFIYFSSSSSSSFTNNNYLPIESLYSLSSNTYMSIYALDLYCNNFDSLIAVALDLFVGTVAVLFLLS